MSRRSKPGSKWQAVIVLIAALLTLFILQRKDNAGFDNDESFRNISHLVFTKHAECRMDCRQIDESEIKEIIRNGKLNQDKSGKSDRGDYTYALEGVSHDNQTIRIVVTPQDNGLLVITVIDLKKEWACNCD
ncbi:MAG: DUF4258 domain-containing protein [Chitinophagaceae bacterium]|nr:DUF4258 domain-containing protein [Chitinophagaceae bacterium]